MYIDFHKYNYDLLSKKERSSYIERDKKAYAEILRKWFKENLSDIVQRKWEIEEILFFKETSDFIKLLKEAENLFEFGFYTGCIALIGVCSEDFTKYLSLKTRNRDLIDNQVSQFGRIKALLEREVITDDIYKNLEQIRVVRNDCLHYKENFKRKDENELKGDSLEVLNSLKITISKFMGLVLEFDKELHLSDISRIVETLGKQLASGDKSIKGFEETTLRMRNAVSHLLNFPIAFEPDQKVLVFEGIFVVKNIDFKCSKFGEVDLYDLTRGGLPVIIDLDEKTKQEVIDEEIKIGDEIYATITSLIDKFGLSSIWKFIDFRRL